MDIIIKEWLENMYNSEIEEVLKTISNEEKILIGCDADDYKMHQENLMRLNTYMHYLTCIKEDIKEKIIYFKLNPKEKNDFSIDVEYMDNGKVLINKEEHIFDPSFNNYKTSEEEACKKIVIAIINHFGFEPQFMCEEIANNLENQLNDK